MKIKEAQFETCNSCQSRRRISDEEYGCDNCKAPIDLTDKDATYLDLTVHQHEGSGDQMQFCSWACVFAKLPTIETDYFISLPFLMFDATSKGQSVRDFFVALRDFKGV